MKVLVTGATGFLGGWLVPRLVQESFEVKILRRQNSDISALEGLAIEHCIGDVTDKESYKKAAEGCDAIFHLAGVIAYEPSKRELMEKVNVGGTKNTIEICEELGIKKLLYLSSVVAIGSSFDGEPLNEDSEFNLNHLNLGYFDTKREAEDLVKKAVENTGLHAVIVNPSTIYGKGDAKKGSRKTQLKVAKGEFPVYPPGGVNVVAVEDVVDGIMLAFEKGRPGRRYILSGENLSLEKLFIEIAREAGVKPPKLGLNKTAIMTMGKLGDFIKPLGVSWPLTTENAWTAVLYHWFDNTRAKEELGFQARPAQHALHESVTWMKEQGLLK